jgi:hypothetical protein
MADRTLVWRVDYKASNVVRKHVRDVARRQLPAEMAGIVVIDRTVASWLDDDDVADACYGTFRIVQDSRGRYSARIGGLLRAGGNTRVAAVISYTRGFVKHFRPSGRDITIFHNPFAKVPIPYDVFAADDVQQTVIVRERNRELYRLKTGKLEAP